MCGVVGMVAQSSVAYHLYDALTVLQHRGQDAAGIATTDHRRLNLRRANGLVRNVFRQQDMDSLHGNMGIAHVCYPTAGSESSEEAQPMYVNSPFGICLAHNGNLTNDRALSDLLFESEQRHINTSSDSEVLLNIFAHELASRGNANTPDAVFDTVAQVAEQAVGAYAVVAMIIGKGIVGFRDPYGIRPLCYGKREAEGKTEYMITSESVALDVLGFELIGDVLPGQAVYISHDGDLHVRQCVERKDYAPCVFEFVYFARRDSVIDGISVYKARLRMGEKLADKILRLYPDHDIDVVMPIPETSCTAALPMAHRLSVKYREGLVKNPYIGRTFIMPRQDERAHSVRRKFNTVQLEFQDKNVLLVDDSIVRGTTTQQIVQMAREAGARNVYLASAAPPVRYPNVYGIDMPAASEFVAHGQTEEGIARYLGVDWLVYQDLEDLKECALGVNDDVIELDCSVFDGRYVTGDVDQAYLDMIERARNDRAKDGAPRGRGIQELEANSG